MPDIFYRAYVNADIIEMAKIRAAEWGTEDYWHQRIAGYLNKQLHPQHALLPRVGFVALKNNSVIGFIAGHLSKRFDCDGELEWINVIKEQRRNGVALALLRLLAKWFTENKARKICVDPGNDIARQFYLKHGAEALNKHWLFWSDIDMLIKNNTE